MRSITLAVLLLAATATAAAAQRCGVAEDSAVVVVGEAVRYELGSGVDAAAFGVDVEGVAEPRTADRLELRAGYRLVIVEDGADPHVARIAIGIPLRVPRVAGFSLCAVVHGGGSWVSTELGDAWVWAGGGGLRLVRPWGDGRFGIVPYIEVRGMTGQAAGELSGLALDANAGAPGGEAGAWLRLGRVWLRAVGTYDPLNARLGLGPYPRWSAGLAVGVPF